MHVLFAYISVLALRVLFIGKAATRYNEESYNEEFTWLSCYVVLIVVVGYMLSICYEGNIHRIIH